MANKKAVLGRPLPDASLPRNAFDVSAHYQFHYPLGAIVPCWWHPVIAGSHLKLSRKIFQRTSDLSTAAFPILDTHVQYYFVPMRQMWSLWDDFKLNIQDVNSTSLFYGEELATHQLPQRVPYVSWQHLSTALARMQSDNAKDILGFSRFNGAKRILNMLGYGQGEPSSVTRDLNLWPILAYHKIYYDHFRNTAYESNHPENYNMDYLWSRLHDMALPDSALYGGSAASSDSGLLRLHYVNYRNDYFNNLYPALNYVQSSPDGANWVIPNNVQGLSSSSSIALSGSTGSDYGRYSLGETFSGFESGVGRLSSVSPNGIYSVPDGSTTGNSYTHNHAITGSANLDLTSALTAQSMRSIFALDKLMRSSAYAPKHAKEQYEARFGIKFKNNPNESFYLGSFKSDVQIGEVTSTATTEQANLGQIGGKGVGFDDYGKPIEFNASEDGIVMAVIYSQVRSSYRALGFDSYLSKHLREDYFQPEFQNLGLEPVYASEFNSNRTDATILGYRPRNQRYKLGVDKNFGLFMDLDQDMSHFINHTDIGRIPTEGATGVDYTWFKVRPQDLDGITRVNYDGSYSTDQFITDIEFGCVINQNMSVHGQPSL